MSPAWINPEQILELFDDEREYREFVADYEELRDELADLKHQLADW